jgi:hypothetical protein
MGDFLFLTERPFNMDSLTLRKSNWWFLTGFALVNILVFSFIILSLTFFLGFGLGAWEFPLAVILSLLLNYFAARHFLPGAYKQMFSHSSVTVLLVVVLSVLFSALFYDISFDGQMYHLEPALQMKAGWNPFRKELPANFNQAIWLNHYGKGVEGPQATIYALTNLIETTKATNFILVIGSFCLCLSLLLRINCFSFRKNILFSILLAFNPVSFYQLLSTYVDGQLSSFLLCFIIVACFLYMDINRYYLLLLAGILIIMVNIKFTAIVFAAVFTIGLLVIFLLSRGWAVFRKLLIVTSLSTAFAFGVVGYFPYITNTLHYHDPLYPGIKAVTKDFSKQMPESFVHRNRFGKLFISFFAHTDNLHVYLDKNPPLPLKIPFTVNKTDLYNAAKPFVVLIAGFGPFFSGIFISSLILFCLFLWRHRQWPNRMAVFGLIITILFSVVLIPESWFARYIPQLWFIPVILLMVSEFDHGKTIGRVRNIVYFFMLFNISFCLAAFPYTYYKTKEIDYELEQLKATHQTLQVQFTYYTSNRARLNETGIPYHEIIIPDSNAVYLVGTSTKYLPPSAMPDLPKPWVLRMKETLSRRFHH